MARTWKILSALLCYPDSELQAAAPDFPPILAEEALLPRPVRRRLDRLIGELASGDPIDLQERYVLRFDRNRSLSLHLFEHVYGESRDRGQAMVDLAAGYEAAGLRIAGRELPDFLPLFLEYLSLLPAREAGAHLADTAHIVAVLDERLRRRRSPYAAVFEALRALAGRGVDKEALSELRDAPDDDPGDLEALDRAWEDAPVTFGPGAGGCMKTQDILAGIGGPAAAGATTAREAGS